MKISEDKTVKRYNTPPKFFKSKESQYSGFVHPLRTQDFPRNNPLIL